MNRGDFIYISIKQSSSQSVIVCRENYIHTRDIIGKMHIMTYE